MRLAGCAGVRDAESWAARLDRANLSRGAGPKCGPVRSRAGLGRGRELDWAAGFSWVGSGLGFLSLSFLFLFYFSLKLNYLNSKEILNSNPYEIKQLKQCISMNASTKFKPMINFNYLRNKT